MNGLNGSWNSGEDRQNPLYVLGKITCVQLSPVDSNPIRLSLGGNPLIRPHTNGHEE